MSSQATVLLTLIVYNLTLVGIGWFARSRTHDGVDFFLGGRKLGPWVAAISAAASSSSAWTLLAVSGAAFQFGVAALWLFPACVGGFMLNWYLIAPRLQRYGHRTGAVTLTDALVGPGDDAMRRLARYVASGIVLFAFSVYVGSQFNGAGKTFAATFDVSETGAILIGAVVVLAYTLLGGFWAVSLTDTLQGLLMAAVAVVLPLMALLDTGGGALWHASGDWTRGFAGFAAFGFVLGTLGIGIGYPGQPHVVNRFMALAEASGAVTRARRVAITWAVLVYAGMLVLGLCGRVLFQQLADGETVFIRATYELFPPVLAGVMIAAVLSAIMSTADSQLLVAASSATHDLGWSGGHRVLLRSRLIVLALGVVAVVIALVMVRNQKLFDSVLFAWSALGAAFGPALVVTLWRQPLSPGHLLVTMLTGFTLSVWASSTTQSPGKVLENVVPSAAGLLVALAPARGRSTRSGDPSSS